MLQLKGTSSAISFINFRFFNTHLPAHRFLKSRVLFLLAILFCSSSYISVATAEIYKWTDEKGKVHFSDKPPANKNKPVEDISDSVNNMNIDSSQNEQGKLNKIFAKETREEKEMREKHARDSFTKQQKEKKEYCEKLKEHLRFIQSGPFYVVDEEGNDHTPSMQELKEIIKRDTKKHEERCS